jgi:predicted dehydrogenase
MADKLKVGIIGAGMISESHMKGLKTDKRAEMVWVADVIEDRAKSRAKEFGVPKVVTDYRPVLTEADAVVVATPPFMHKAPTIDAAEAGKHVLCEKPMAMSSKEAKEMADACEKAKVHLSICSSRRNFRDEVQGAREAVAQGKLGDVYYSRISSLRKRGRPGFDFWPDVTWFLDSEKAGGGAIMDIGCYDIDTLLFMTGAPEPVSVSAVAYAGIGSKKVPQGVKHDVDEHLTCLVRFANGSSAVFESAWATNVEFGVNPGGGIDVAEYFLMGKKGGVRLKPPQLFTEVGGTPKGKAMTEKYKAEGLQADFVSACLGKKSQPATPGRVGVMITQIIEGALLSAKENREVKIAELMR